MKASDEDVIQTLVESEKIPNFKQILPVNIYHFYIVDEIKEPSYYIDLIHTLKIAEEHDTIFIYLNTPGGHLTTATQIMGAIKNCNGTVITCLEGEVCSAGTMIFLCGHKHIVNPFGTFMIHNYSHGLYGKGKEVASRVKYSETYFTQLAKDVYADFLTEDEIDAVLSDKDIWLTSEEVYKRLTDKAEKQNNQLEEQLKIEAAETYADNKISFSKKRVAKTSNKKK